MSLILTRLLIIPFILLLISTLASARDSDPDQTIIVGGDYSYPPYEFLDDKGDPSGYNVELTLAIAEVMGMKVEFRFSEWAKVRKALADGEIDALQGMVNSQERRKTFDFSPPHAIVHQSIFARRGEPFGFP